jgi:hypothetical protein
MAEKAEWVGQRRRGCLANRAKVRQRFEPAGDRPSNLVGTVLCLVIIQNALETVRAQ